MKRKVAVLAFLAVFPLLSLTGNALDRPAAEGAVAQHANLPLSFEPTAAPGRYVAHSGAYSIAISAGEAFVAVADVKSGSARVLRFAFEKANAAARIELLDRLPGVTNYYLGPDERNWRLAVPNFARLRTQAVYPGVDVVFYGDQRRLEFDFVVAPKADPGVIVLALSGMDNLSTSAEGDLVAEINGREIRFAKPFAYQLVAGEKRTVKAEYVLADNSRAQLRIGEYDQNRELVIDPLLQYSSYLGGSQGDTGNGIAVDGNENVYLTGQSCSPDFPTFGGTAFVPVQGSCAAYVTKLPADTSNPFTTFIAGTQPANGFAVGNGIALDNPALHSLTNPIQPSGAVGVSIGHPNVYVAGTTSYRNLSSLIAYAGGDSDAFVAILDSITGALVNIPGRNGLNGSNYLLTYLGGGFADAGYSIAVDPYQNVTVAGQTQSLDFPAYNGFQPKTEEYVAFASKLDFGLHIPAMDTGGTAGCTHANMICPGSSAMTPRPSSNADTCASSSTCPPTANPTNPYYFYSVLFGGQLVPPESTWPVGGGGYVTGYPVPPNAITVGTPSGTGNLVTCPGNITPQVLVAESAPFNGGYQHSGFLNWAAICTSITVNSRVADCSAIDTSVSPPVCQDPTTHSGNTFRFNWRILGPVVGAAYATTEAYGVALDPGGDAFVVGGSSTASLEPVNIYWLPGMHYAGTGAWIIKLLGNDTNSNLAGTGSKDAGTPVYLTPLGTNPTDLTQTVNAARAVTVDTQGRAYVAGTATGGIYTTSNSWQPNTIGAEDAFLLRMNTAGSGIEYSTYLGGTGNDQGLTVAVDAGGWAYLAGSTQSADIPLINPLSYGNNCGTSGICVTLNQIKGTQDAYLVKISPDGSSLIMSAYLGGAGLDQANAIALGTAGSTSDIFVAGNTTSVDFPIQSQTNSPVQTAYTGNGDAFVTRISGASFPQVQVQDANGAPVYSLDFSQNQTVKEAVGWSSSALQVYVKNTGQATVQFSKISISGDFSQTNNCVTNTQLLVSGSCTITVIFTPTGVGTRNGVLTITDNATNSPQTVGLIGIGTLVLDAVSPPTLTFGTVTVGATSTAQNVTVKNTDPNWNLIMSSVLATGDFNVSSNGCNSLLAPQQSCLIGVTFTPTTAGSRNGTLVINGNGIDFPYTVSLSGTGNGTGASPGGSGPDFSLTGPASQSVTAGTPATFLISLAGLGTFNQTVSLSCAGTGNITCSISPTSVTVNGSTGQTATVTVTVPKSQQILIGNLSGTPANSPAAWAAGRGRSARLLAAMLPFGALGLVLAGRRRRWLALLLLVLCLGAGMIGCGGGGSSSSTPPQITITATPGSGSTSHLLVIALNVS